MTTFLGISNGGLYFRFTIKSIKSESLTGSNQSQVFGLPHLCNFYSVIRNFSPGSPTSLIELQGRREGWGQGNNCRSLWSPSLGSCLGFQAYPVEIIAAQLSPVIKSCPRSHTLNRSYRKQPRTVIYDDENSSDSVPIRGKFKGSLSLIIMMTLHFCWNISIMHS